jgi:hypothetical protein
LHSDRGVQLRRVPPGRLPLRHASQRARRHDHPRRSALHAHVCGGRYLRPDPQRLRYRLPRRADQLDPHERALLQRIRHGVHQRVVHRARGFRRYGRTRRPLLRVEYARCEIRRRLRHVHLGLRNRRGAALRRQWRNQAPQTRREPTRPALRAQSLAPPLRALHGRYGRRGLRHAARGVRANRQHLGRQ